MKPIGKSEPTRLEHAERQERLATLGTLASGIAHEINNPLSYVVANLDFSATELEELLAVPATALPAGFRQRLVDLSAALSDARVGAEQLRRIVRDVRGFASVGEKAGHPVELTRVIESAVRLVSTKTRERARVQTSFGTVPLVVGSESRLCQVFVNLLANAAEACSPDRRDANEIHVSTRTDIEGDGGAIVEVRDTGSGIDPGDLPRVFDAFFTTRRGEDGIGLGLSIVKEIVTSLDGTIEVESEVGKGSLFRVRLPFAMVTPRTARRDSVRANERRGRVMIVDDEPAVLSALNRLVSLHHEVVPIRSGLEALDLLRGGARFDAILCDLMMPELTGMGLHEALVSERPEMATRMVFISAGAFTPEARAFLERVPNDRIFKPFDVGAVREAIRKAIV
jgi:nitrogen-specific signal transduction histidine kinase/CheY-like chemotaxis protein